MHHGASRCIAVHFSRYPTSELEKLSTISELEKLSTSELEKLSTPNLEKILEKLPTPEHEKLSKAEFEKFSIPELDNLSTSELEKLSTSELEKLSTPDLEKILEKLSTSELEKLSTPEPEKLSKPDRQKVSTPELEKLSTPECNKRKRPENDFEDSSLNLNPVTFKKKDVVVTQKKTVLNQNSPKIMMNRGISESQIHGGTPESFVDKYHSSNLEKNANITIAKPANNLKPNVLKVIVGNYDSARYHMSDEQYHNGILLRNCSVKIQKLPNRFGILAKRMKKQTFHVGNKPYICNVCDEAFFTNNI